MRNTHKAIKNTIAEKGIASAVRQFKEDELQAERLTPAEQRHLDYVREHGDIRSDEWEESKIWAEQKYERTRAATMKEEAPYPTSLPRKGLSRSLMKLLK